MIRISLYAAWPFLSFFFSFPPSRLCISCPLSFPVWHYSQCYQKMHDSRSTLLLSKTVGLCGAFFIIDVKSKQRYPRAESRMTHPASSHDAGIRHIPLRPSRASRPHTGNQVQGPSGGFGGGFQVPRSGCMYANGTCSLACDWENSTHHPLRIFLRRIIIDLRHSAIPSFPPTRTTFRLHWTCLRDRTVKSST